MEIIHSTNKGEIKIVFSDILQQRFAICTLKITFQEFDLTYKTIVLFPSGIKQITYK